MGTALRYQCTMGVGEPSAVQGNDIHDSIFCSTRSAGLDCSTGRTATAQQFYNYHKN